MFVIPQESRLRKKQLRFLRNDKQSVVKRTGMTLELERQM